MKAKEINSFDFNASDTHIISETIFKYLQVELL